MNNEKMPLSKWWKTESAQAALQRAVERRKEAINKMRNGIAARKLALTQAVIDHYLPLTEQRHEKPWKGVRQ